MSRRWLLSIVLLVALVATGRGEGLRLADVGGNPPRAIPADVGEMMYLATLTPGDHRVVTGGWKQPVRIWDTLGKEQLRFEGRTNIDILDFSRDGKLAAGASGSHPLSPNPISIWEVATGKVLRSINLDIKDKIRDLHFLDRQTLAAIASRGPRTTVYTFDVDSGKEQSSFDVPYNNWWRFAFSGDGGMLAAAGRQGTAYLYDVRTGKDIRQFKGGKPGAISSDCMALAIAPDGRLLGGAYYCTMAAPAPAQPHGDVRIILHIWDIASGRELRQWELARVDDVTESCFHLAFSPDGRALAMRSLDATVLWEVASGRQRRRFSTERWSSVKNAAFSDDGTLLVWNELDGRAMLWDLTGARRHGKLQSLALTAAERQDLWSRLASQDAAKGFQAVQGLAADPNTPDFLRDQLSQIGKVDAKRIARLVDQLDDDRFAVRDQAQKELEVLGAAATAALKKAAAEGKSLEHRRRAEQLLAGIQNGTLASDLLLARSFEVLERLGTPQATSVVESLAKSDDAGGIAAEAKHVLKRMKKLKNEK
jgi:WD40 repeat protein